MSWVSKEGVTMLNNLKPNLYNMVTTIILLLFAPVIPIMYGMHAQIGSVAGLEFFSTISLISLIESGVYF